MSQQQYTCPVHSRHTQDIVGCGATFQATPSSDGLVECPPMRYVVCTASLHCLLPPWRFR